MRRARSVAALCGAVGFLVTVTTVPAAAPAVADTTTSSTRTTAWTDQNPRHPEDGPNAADPRPFARLKDLTLRVSQTQDLLNQTVEVSWTGLGTTGKQAFLQLMQCWSEGPTVAPTREQCAFGGIDVSGAEGSGQGRTRQLSVDPRERTYLNNGDLNPVAVDGASPTAAWAPTAELVLGTNQQTCPATATGYTVTLVPPRAAVRAGSVPDSLPALAPVDARPGSLARQENGFTRRYATVTAPFRMADLGPAGGLPLGQYRLQLGCRDAAGTEVARFVGYLEQAEVGGARLWRRSAHEGGVVVPFDPLGDTPDTAATDPYERDQVLEYLKPRSTNEIWRALRRVDGGGSVFMEMLTDLDAQHLGCGRVESTRVRSCWLVAVPRFGVEPDHSEQESATLYSPLSQTLWDRRIEVPLTFAPVAAGCRIGSGLKQVLSHDAALNALRSWQPTFCDDPTTAASVLGPLQDFSVRAGLSKPNRLGVVGIPDEQGATVVKAPVATSGVVVGFAVDRQIAFGREDDALDGTRTTELNLTPRLLAKLLTQSYDSGAAPNGGKQSGVNSPERSGTFRPTYTPARDFPQGNPRTLYADPEFLALNPDFARWLDQSVALPPLDMAEILVTPNDTDAYQVLWQWVVADPAAKAFLDGAPDPHGMLINPYYKGQITEATSSFPLLDPTCIDDLEDSKADAFPLLCQINNHPRVEDDTKAAQAAVRGDTKRVNLPPPLFTGAAGEVLGYLPEPRQQQGRQGMLVITNSAVAQRFGLPTARLQNADGAFVGADANSLARARERMTPRADGVLIPRPGSVRHGGYPLTTNSYAVVDVAATTPEQNKAFAEILDYAAGPGQVVGTSVGKLPPGYAPLTPALAGQTRAGAALLRNPAALLPRPPAATPTPGPAATVAPSAGGRAQPGLVSDPVEVAPPVPPVVGPPNPATLTAPVSVTGRASTSLQWLLPGVLLLGLAAAFGGRVLSLIGRPSS